MSSLNPEPTEALRRDLRNALIKLLRGVALPHKHEATRRLFAEVSGRHADTCPRSAETLVLTLQPHLETRRDVVAVVGLIAQVLRETPLKGRDLASEWTTAANDAFRSHGAPWRFDRGSLIQV
ncbi:MAG: hypothetical protein HOW73_48515 [Polyangiaceae bacterium]|nr:hypothetical protein [Polyangiaceae bacterium]